MSPLQTAGLVEVASLNAMVRVTQGAFVEAGKSGGCGRNSAAQRHTTQATLMSADQTAEIARLHPENERPSYCGQGRWCG